MYNRNVLNKKGQKITKQISLASQNAKNIGILVNPEKEDLFANFVFGFDRGKLNGIVEYVEWKMSLEDMLKKYEYVICMHCLYNQTDYDVSHQFRNEHVVDVMFSIPNSEFGNEDYNPLLFDLL